LKNIEEIKKEVIDLNEEIGRGAYGVVKKVSLHGVVCVAKEIHEVLIKNSNTETIKEKFLKECLMCSKLFHPNIVQFLGIYYPSKDANLPWLVMEKLHCNLVEFLDKYTNDVHNGPFFGVKTSIIHDVSLGLRYLHSRNIIHRDLTSKNILLTKHLTAKIADLGVAKVIDPDSLQQLTQTPGNAVFLPKEAMQAEPHYGKSVDIFSLGCVMIHLMTHEWPKLAAQVYYDPKRKKNVSLTEIQRRSKYLDNMKAPKALKMLILQCLNDSPDTRPKITELCEQLRKSCLQQKLLCADNALELMIQNYYKENEEKKVGIQKLGAALQHANEQLQPVQVML